MTDDAAQLNAELARAYTRLAELSRDLADEQVLTRSLRVVVALRPFNQSTAPTTVLPELPRPQKL